MTRLSIERVGGFAGFGPGSRIRSRGEIDVATLSEGDRAAVAGLFDRSDANPPPPAIADGFRYRITRDGGTPRTIEVPEAAVPPSVRDCVRDELN